MIVEGAQNLNMWERQMITHTSPKAVLFAEEVSENGKNELWYDITGMQSLDTLLETGVLCYELLCKILVGIYRAVEELEAILLQADGLLLLPECIFADYRTGELSFCYCLGHNKGLPKSFEELVEYLLTKADHEEEETVELIYSVYERATKGNGSLKELKDVLRMPYEREDSEADELREDGSAQNVNTEVFIEQETQNECEYEFAEKAQEKEKRKDRTFRIKDLLEGKMQKGLGCGRENRWGSRWNGLLEWLKGHQGKRSGIKLHKKNKRDAGDAEAFVFEPELEAVQPSRPTVLLAELTRPPEGILRYEGKGACKDLVIEGDSYVIGSEMECAGYIPSTTVSRKHARIIKKEGIFFIEDLNSSNGTYVGGELLNYKTKVSLQKNEIVIFADEKFRFI